MVYLCVLFVCFIGVLVRCLVAIFSVDLSDLNNYPLFGIDEI